MRGAYWSDWYYGNMDLDELKEYADITGIDPLYIETLYNDGYPLECIEELLEYPDELLMEAELMMEGCY